MKSIKKEHEDNIAFEYIKSNIVHEFRTQFSTINVSLNSLNSIFPTLVQGYNRACEADLIKNEYNNDYLQLIHKSIINSLEGIIFSDHFLNKLILLMNKEKFGLSNTETININFLLKKIIHEKEIRGKKIYQIISEHDMEIQSNLKEIECCIKGFMEDLESCYKEQKSDHINIIIKHVEKSITFGFKKSKQKSYVLESIENFIQGNNKDRHGLGVYLMKNLVESQLGHFHILNSPQVVEFTIKF